MKTRTLIKTLNRNEYFTVHSCTNSTAYVIYWVCTRLLALHSLLNDPKLFHTKKHSKIVRLVLTLLQTIE